MLTFLLSLPPETDGELSLCLRVNGDPGEVEGKPIGEVVVGVETTFDSKSLTGGFEEKVEEVGEATDPTKPKEKLGFGRLGNGGTSSLSTLKES